MKHEILVYNKTRKRAPEKFIKTVILKALDLLKLKQPAELAVLIVDEKEIKRLNKIWRKTNETPDELSFGLNTRKIEALAKLNNGVLNLGEIVINAEKISERNYLTKILIHCLLHLLGYNHEKPTVQTKKMEHLEKKILKYLNTKY